MAKVVVLIDGGHVRALVRKLRPPPPYHSDYIEKVARACVLAEESLLRVLYYDCAPFKGTVRLPVSGNDFIFDRDDQLLRMVARKELFAVRRGVLKFRGFKPKRIPVAPQTLTDDDFSPDFEQKGVDMRIGLDIASYAADRTVDRIILLSGDTDCLPAMKRARMKGLQVVMVSLGVHNLAPELLEHSDFERRVAWPAL